jgi:hypothetical protein
MWPFDAAAPPTAAPAATAKPRVAIARLEVPANLILPIIIRVETTFLHDAMIDALVHAGVLEVVERTRIDKLLEEQGLTKNGITDPAQAAALGKVLGASVFAVGILRDVELRVVDRPLPYTTRTERAVDSRIHFDFRLFEVETSRVIQSGTVDARAEQALVLSTGTRGESDAIESLWEEAQRQAAGNFAAQVVDTLVPLRIVNVEAGRAELNRGTSTGIGTGLVCDVLDARQDPVAQVKIATAAATHAAGELVGNVAAVKADMRCRPQPPAPPSAPVGRQDPLQQRW